ncbi:DUF4157 domain-containing protein [Pedobacter sp. HMF7647]|uniref:DUF4157 domain-containing protein n=1 Tax=Hufsiella arboris TaxID=2695275 RepID=A0A7K1Y5I5_9SPHI|nr:DUF4157 domain-containing protein [Hufsiella arboris]MXV49680.1 DUF4157 domain-containing protein [Hufsiella arboris]
MHQPETSNPVAKTEDQSVSRFSPTIDTLDRPTICGINPVQYKLTVGAPDDPLEREADAVADQVMRMPENGFIQRKCSHCEEEEKAQRKIMPEFIQRKTDANGSTAPEAVSQQIQAEKGRGTSIDKDTRSFMESRFNTSFSDVQIHNDYQSAQLSQSLNAKAFTTGSDIYFNSGQYQSNSSEGKKLLAHELTHTIQQGNNQLNKKIQRASYYPQVTGGSATGITDFAGAYTILSPLNSTDIIDTLDELERRNPRSVFSLLSNLGSATGPVGVTRLRVYFLGFKNARYQNDMSAAELQDLATNITALPLQQQQAIQTYITTHRSAVSQDLYTGSHIPTAAEQASIETIFNPGATTSVSSTGTITVTPPTVAPVCSNATAFTTRIRGVLEPIIRTNVTAFRARRAAPATFPISQANTMADLAQAEVESYFRPFLARASRSGAAGSYSLGGGTRASSLLRDQSTTTRWQTEGGRLGWLKYWYDHLTGNLNDTLHCDDAQITAALTPMARDTTLIPLIDDYVQSWPAEATGGINIQPYLDASNLVCSRWDTFTTIIHEFIHLLAHPNFETARNALPNNAMETLKEGLDDVLRKELWEGTGNLKNRLISTSGTANRTVIEGGTFPLNTAQVCSHGYYDNLPDAERIVSTVGRQNIKLAYFLGQTEYLGLGTGSTLSPGGSLATSSFYTTSDAANMDQVNVIAGETREQLLLRTNGTEIRRLNNVVLAPGEALPATVKIPGVRHVYIHNDDSLISIAVQNGVTPYEIMRANNLTSSTITTGTRLIIPRH